MIHEINGVLHKNRRKKVWEKNSFALMVIVIAVVEYSSCDMQGRKKNKYNFCLFLEWNVIKFSGHSKKSFSFGMHTMQCDDESDIKSISLKGCGECVIQDASQLFWIPLLEVFFLITSVGMFFFLLSSYAFVSVKNSHLLRQEAPKNYSTDTISKWTTKYCQSYNLLIDSLIC